MVERFEDMSFMKFIDNDLSVQGLTTSEAWDIYIVKVKGRLQSELQDFTK
jgi:hypothetical protein